MFTTGYFPVRFALLLTVSIRLQFENMFSQDNKKGRLRLGSTDYGLGLNCTHLTGSHNKNVLRRFSHPSALLSLLQPTTYDLRPLDQNRAH